MPLLPLQTDNIGLNMKSISEPLLPVIQMLKQTNFAERQSSWCYADAAMSPLLHDVSVVSS